MRGGELCKFQTPRVIVKWKHFDVHRTWKNSRHPSHFLRGIDGSVFILILWVEQFNSVKYPLPIEQKILRGKSPFGLVLELVRNFVSLTLDSPLSNFAASFNMNGQKSHLSKEKNKNRSSDWHKINSFEFRKKNCPVFYR